MNGQNNTGILIDLVAIEEAVAVPGLIPVFGLALLLLLASLMDSRIPSALPRYHQ